MRLAPDGSRLLQRLVVELWRDGQVGAAIGRAAASYDQRRERLTLRGAGWPLAGAPG
jgi:hypothetical protein